MSQVDDNVPLHIETPLLESRPLSASSGKTVWLKMENRRRPAHSRFVVSGSLARNTLAVALRVSSLPLEETRVSPWLTRVATCESRSR